MDTLNILKYIASNLEVFEVFGVDEYNACKDYYIKYPNVKLTFDPLLWFCSNINKVVTDPGCELLINRNKNPDAIVFNKLGLSYNGEITKQHKINITRLALEIGVSIDVTFDWMRYYHMYSEQIEHYYERHRCEEDSIQEKTCMFYACYGYYTDLHLKPINPLLYIASYPDVLVPAEIDEEAAARDFYQNGNVIKFDAYVYIASNWNNEQIRDLVNCIGAIDESRVAKYYIRNGVPAKHETSSFDGWSFLANNPKRIKNLLDKKDNNLRYEYDVYKLTQRNIAKEFVRKMGKSKKNSFNAVKFVKRYIDDDMYVNKERKLDIKNAAEYFVKYFVISSKIRFESSWKYRIAMFFKARFVDSMKQIPFHAVKYLTETAVF